MASTHETCVGLAPLIVLGASSATYTLGGVTHDVTEEYHALGTAPGFYHDMHTGRDPIGIATQDPELEARLDPVAGTRRVVNYLRSAPSQVSETCPELLTGNNVA